MLDFYYSTMRGGKSTALLQKRHDLIAIGKSVLVITSSLDDRYGIGKVTSRMGPQCDAELFSSGSVFDKRILVHDFDELFIDEAQFLSAQQVHQIHANLCAGLNLRVSCFGLRTNFRGKPFEGSATLLALADNLHEISTLCHCGAKATLNQRVDARGNPVRDGDILEIGGDSRYRPVCPRCFY